MTGRNFAKKTNIRFNYFGARTSRHGHEFLGPHSFFRPRARILRHNSAEGPARGRQRRRRCSRYLRGRDTANALCIGRDCDQLVFHRAVAVFASSLYIGGCDLARRTGKEQRDGSTARAEAPAPRLSHPSTHQAGNRRPAGPIDAMRDPGRVDRGLRRRPHHRGGRHRGLHDVTMCQRRSSIYSATGRAPDTDRILTLARSSQASLGPADNRRSTFENQSKQILERASQKRSPGSAFYHDGSAMP